MKKVLLIIAMVMLVASPVFALSVGESLLTNPSGFNAYLDWAVMNPGELGTAGASFGAGAAFNYQIVVPGVNQIWSPTTTGGTVLSESGFASAFSGKYLYFYQLENQSVPIATGQVNINDFVVNNILAMGFLNTVSGNTAVDLDGIGPGGLEAFEGVLNPAAIPTQMAVFFGTKQFSLNVGGSSNPLAVGEESTTIFFVSDYKPTMGDANVLGVSTDSYSGKVPVPSPEPASMALLGIGLAGLARFRRRMA